MIEGRVLRCELRSASQRELLAIGPLPPAGGVARPARILMRDLYLDSAEGALRARGVTCRLRIASDGRRRLTLVIDTPPGTPAGMAPARADRVDAWVRDDDPRLALAGRSLPARRLRGIVDPASLLVQLELEVDRWTRVLARDWLGRPALLVHLDAVTGRGVAAGITLHHLSAHAPRAEASTLEALAAYLRTTHGLAPGAGSTRERVETLVRWRREGRASDDALGSGGMHRIPSADPAPLPEFLDPELGLIGFQERVLAMAEREEVPIAERLRFLSIVSANLDEYYAVRVAALRGLGPELPEERGDLGFTLAEELERIEARIAALVRRQARCAERCLASLARQGARVTTWERLGDAARAALRERFADEVLPALTPFAMTLSPGHPLPHLQHLAVSLAMQLRDPGGRPHVAELELPAGMPRFVSHAAADGALEILPLEALVRANLDLVYPHEVVEHAFAFRVTRAGALPLDELASGDLLDAVDAAVAQHGLGAPVRLEVEPGMPETLRRLLLESLRREKGADGGAPAPDTAIVQEVPGLLDLRGLESLPLPPRLAGGWPAFLPREPVPPGRPLVEALRDGDLLVHHPFDSFDATVLRFIDEAATDPAVTAIKLTLYRVGESSRVLEALTEAARAGKEVAAFVELKARFDEERNARCARALETAGGRVIYGLVGLKNHAKVALVVRREAGKLRRYVHVGTGNYNARTARQYTDLSLLSSDPALGSDVADLFNALTGTSRAPQALSRGALVAPTQLCPALVAMIDAEGKHARAGRPAGITIKVNGLTDAEVARALARAAAEGVPVRLIVRGACTLRPADGIEVLSVVGRFLEHSRVYRFENGGERRHFIGSADLRPRNLRRRVELLVPVHDAGARAALDRLLTLYLEDPTAWVLRPDGEYVQRGGGTGAQERLLREAVSSSAPPGTSTASPATT
ncbi:MAG TPA: polyphosphate kinase 1 [Gemmatimonadaceae bacterium]